MKAARWYGRRDVRVVDIPDPVPAAGQVVLRVGYCGICGTDVDEYVEGPVLIPEQPHPLTGRSAPLTLGHEFAGTVADSNGSMLTEGTRVVPEVVLSCGRCRYCLRGDEALCVSWAAHGLQADGGLAEYVAVAADACLRVPETITDEEAAMIEPTEVAVRAVRKAHLQSGGTAAVIGAGTIGLLALQTLLAAGASTVCVIEPREERRRLAMELGATEAFTGTSDEVVSFLHESFDGNGPESIVECAGHADSTDVAVRAVAKGGTVVLVAIQPGAVPLSTAEIAIGEKRLVGSIQHELDDDLRSAVGLLARGEIRVVPLVSARIRLNEVVTGGFDELLRPDSQAVKILVRPNP